MKRQAEAPGGATSREGAQTTTKSFEDQVLAQRESLRRLAMYLCRNRSEADDLVQEVLFRAFRYRAQFRDGTNHCAWLRTIMRNTHLLRSRTSRRQADYDPERLEARLATSTDPTLGLELDDVRRALTLLPERYRQALLLAAGGGSYDEISFILRCPVGTVKSRLSRARGLLRAVLAEGEFKLLACSREPLAALEAQFRTLMPGE